MFAVFGYAWIVELADFFYVKFASFQDRAQAEDWINKHSYSGIEFDIVEE